MIDIVKQQELFMKPDWIQSYMSIDAKNLAALGQLNLGRYVPQTDNGILTLQVRGFISPEDSFLTQAGVGTSLAALRSEINESNCNKVVFEINSGGGIAQGCFDFFSFVKGLECETEARVDGTCASAAYYIASACDKIYSTEDSQIGSIGCAYSYMDNSKQLEKEGLKEVVLTSSYSKNKMALPGSAAFKAEGVELLDGACEKFITCVAEGRGVSFDDVLNNFGQGKCFLAGKAKDLGMIDDFFKKGEIKMTTQNTKPEILAQKAPVAPTTPVAPVASVVPTEVAPNLEEIRALAYSEGIKAEAQRIQEIDALAHLGQAELVAAAKANSQITAGELAIAILSAQKKTPMAANATAQPFAKHAVPATAKTLEQIVMEQKLVQTEDNAPQEMTAEEQGKQIASYFKNKAK